MCIRQWCDALLVARLVVHVLELVLRTSRLIANLEAPVGIWHPTVGTTWLL